MLYQDTLTGALHEIPDGQIQESEFSEYPYQMGEPVFDGLGNPVGFLPFIPKIAALASLAPKVGGLVGGLLRRRNPLARVAAAAIPAAAAAAVPAAAAAVPAAMSALAMRRAMPPGWMRRPNPYTGMPGRRIYMNCRLYPGPRGLVPVSAAQAVPGAPGLIAPGAAVPVPAAGRRRRRRR
jgi:hypothetical protein